MARSVPAVVRALDVLELFLDGRGSLSAPEVAAALDLPRTTTHELLATLSERDYVERLPDNAHRFRLGVRVSELGSVYADALDIVRDGQALVEEVSARCGEICQLGLLDGRDVVYVARAGLSAAAIAAVDSTPIAVNPRRTAAVRTAAGRVLLANLPRPDLDRRLTSLGPVAGTGRPIAGTEAGGSQGGQPAPQHANSQHANAQYSNAQHPSPQYSSGQHPSAQHPISQHPVAHHQAGSALPGGGLRGTAGNGSDAGVPDAATAERLRVWRELTAVLARGVATDAEVGDPSSRAIAAAIRDHTGRVVAALEIRTPVARWEPQRAVGLETLVRRAALRASTRLGFRPPRVVEPGPAGAVGQGPRSLSGAPGHGRVFGAPGSATIPPPGAVAAPPAARSAAPTRPPGQLVGDHRMAATPPNAGAPLSPGARPLPPRLPAPVRAVDGGGLRPIRPPIGGLPAGDTAARQPADPRLPLRPGDRRGAGTGAPGMGAPGIGRGLPVRRPGPGSRPGAPAPLGGPATRQPAEASGGAAAGGRSLPAQRPVGQNAAVQSAALQNAAARRPGLARPGGLPGHASAAPTAPTPAASRAALGQSGAGRAATDGRSSLREPGLRSPTSEPSRTGAGAEGAGQSTG